MKLQRTYCLGLHLMYYEIRMFLENTNSVLKAVENIENPENITIDICFNLSQYFEKIDIEQITKEQLIKQYEEILQKLIDRGLKVNSKIYENDTEIFTIANYRRNLNYNYCDKTDFIIWNESDCLIPSQTFQVIEQISEYAKSIDINRYIITFAVRKMWDSSWKELEHEKFTNRPYYEMTDPKSATELSSIRYTATQEEMDAINSEAKEIDLKILTKPVFDGSGLIISTDLIKMGINIPHANLMVSEDEGFRRACEKIMGNDYRQFHVANLLKIHNRENPKKRLYVKGEDNSITTHHKRSGNSWYQELSKLSKYNNSIMYDSQKKFYTYIDLKETR